ncbi:MAG: hypothetical protein RhofKO_08990 [Rhodothermales bacterium]
MSKHGTAVTTKKLFSRSTTIIILIQTEAQRIWNLLIDAAGYPDWNSTVVSIDGTIQQGETIKLKSTLAPERVFKLKVKEMTAPQKLAWGDAMGTRTYTLTPQPSGVTLFTMTETIGGPLFPLFAHKIPSFDAAFEHFAADLKKEAERR